LLPIKKASMILWDCKKETNRKLITVIERINVLGSLDFFIFFNLKG